MLRFFSKDKGVMLVLCSKSPRPSSPWVLLPQEKTSWCSFIANPTPEARNSPRIFPVLSINFGLIHSPNIPVPHIYRSPFNDIAAEWEPAEIDLNLTSVFIFVGVFVDFLHPVPSCPQLLLPNASTSEWEFSRRVCWSPQAIAAIFSIETLEGEALTIKFKAFVCFLSTASGILFEYSQPHA